MVLISPSPTMLKRLASKPRLEQERPRRDGEGQLRVGLVERRKKNGAAGEGEGASARGQDPTGRPRVVDGPAGAGPRGTADCVVVEGDPSNPPGQSAHAGGGERNARLASRRAGWWFGDHQGFRRRRGRSRDRDGFEHNRHGGAGTALDRHVHRKWLEGGGGRREQEIAFDGSQGTGQGQHTEGSAGEGDRCSGSADDDQLADVSLGSVEGLLQEGSVLVDPSVVGGGQ